mgnify:CR=1 FL=1
MLKSARIAVFVSGGGTNLQALLDAQRDGKIPHGEIALVISSQACAYALERAEKANVPAHTVPSSLIQHDFEAAIELLLEQYKIDVIVLAGFLSILSENFTKKWPRRILNIHPSLIPSFCGRGMYGLKVHEAALARGVKVTGATVHFVNEIPDGGEILLDGTNIWQDKKTTRESRFRVGLVFQYPEYQLFEETVYKDIAFGPGNMGLDKEEIDRRVRESARMVGLAEELLEKSPFDLSGGQKRRVAIAGVMAMEPKVLILDEPTAGLDPRGRDEILAQIRAYHETKQATVILVSHSMEEIARNVGRIVVMRDAHVYMDGTPRQVFARAEELEQAGLDVPQVTKIAMALRRRGMDIDPAVYTIEELEQALLNRRGGGEKC